MDTNGGKVTGAKGEGHSAKRRLGDDAGGAEKFTEGNEDNKGQRARGEERMPVFRCFSQSVTRWFGCRWIGGSAVRDAQQRDRDGRAPLTNGPSFAATRLGTFKQPPSPTAEGRHGLLSIAAPQL